MPKKHPIREIAVAAGKLAATDDAQLNIKKVDAALQAMWDSAPAPEWVTVIEPISFYDEKLGITRIIEPGHYVRDAKGDYTRRPDDEAQP